MKIVKNEKLIQRNSKIGQYTSMGALGVLGIGMYISFKHQDLFIWSIAALLTGFAMTQIGMYFGNRWGRSPRPDEKFDAGLKGLPSDYTLYHFVTPASHLLVGPAGVWALIPYRQRGVVTYSKNRWRVGNGGFLQAYMSIFGQEGIGRPDLEAESEINAIQKLLDKALIEILGKAETIGRPILYGTSPKFMEYFGISELAELPTPKDFTEEVNTIGEAPENQ